MDINMNPIIAVLILSPVLVFAGESETKEVKLPKSSISFAPFRSHQGKVSPWAALADLSDVDVTNHIPENEDRYLFKKAVGPFTFVDVRLTKDAKPLFFGLEPLGNVGVATQIVSCVTRKEPTFETAVLHVRDVKNKLAHEARIYNFVEKVEEGSCYDIKTESPAFGGWMVFISVRRVKVDEYEYKILLERRLESSLRARDILVEVDI